MGGALISCMVLSGSYFITPF